MYTLPNIHVYTAYIYIYIYIVYIWLGNFASQDFGIFVCAIVAEVSRRLAETRGECHFPLKT